MTRILVVEEAFAARGGGVHVMPKLVLVDPPRAPIAVVLVGPGGARRTVRASVETAHIRGPSGSFAMLRLHDVDMTDVPPGTEIHAGDGVTLR